MEMTSKVHVERIAPLGVECLDSIYELKIFSMSFSKTFVYGAGFYGYCLYNCCREQKINIDGFIVSDSQKEQNGDLFCELPIISLSQLIDDDNFGVVVAVRQELQGEILEELIKSINIKCIKCVRDGSFLEEYMGKESARRLNEIWYRIKSFFYPIGPSESDKKRENLLKQKYRCIRLAVLDAYILGRFCLDYHSFFNMRLEDRNSDTYYVLLLDFSQCTEIVNPAIYERMKSSSKGILEMIDNENASFWHYYLHCHADDVVIEKISGWVDLWALAWRKEYLYTGYCKFFKYKPSIMFDDSDEMKCMMQLDLLGIKEPYMCIFARDSAYKNESGNETNKARNTNIDNFKDTTRYFYSRGIQSVRMGAKVNKKYCCEGAIDYATIGRTPINDLYVFSKCEFCILDGSGIATIPMLFMKCFAFTNILVPIQSGEITFPVEIYLPVTYYDCNRQRKLKLREVIHIYMSGYTEAPHENDLREFTRRMWNMGVEFVYNTPDEILEISKEIYEISKGMVVYTDEDKSLRDKYRKLIIEEIKDYPNVQFAGMLGRQWLRDNASWYLE